MRPTVVVVEDDPDILDLLGEIISGEGLEVRAFSRPDLFAIQRDAGVPALFVLDIMLPGMSGVDLARHLQHLYPRTPIIATSASRLMLEVARGSGLFTACIPKPFELADLLEAVEQCIWGAEAAC
jgi:two-component system alkaline phosphatase synthesis response regulator PhoP